MPHPRHGERLSAADASNVVLDAPDRVNVFLLAGTLGSGGFVTPDGALDMDALRAAITVRLAEQESGPLARFSQRVHRRGRELEWRASPPDPVHHVRLADPVNGRQGLADMCASLMTSPMSLDRPLWELLVVPGASASGPGIVLRVHHAMADGFTGVRLLRRLFDSTGLPESAGSTTAQPRPQTVPPTSAPAAPAAPATDSAPAGGRAWRTFASHVARVSSMFRSTVPPTVLLGPIGAKRGVAFTEVDLGVLARAARGAGATVNDALLAAVTTAVEAALRADGQPVPAVLPASVPVALPEHGRSGNAVGLMLVPLTTGEPDTATRLAQIAAITRSSKSAARSQGTFELTRSRWGTRLLARLAKRQRFIALFVSNVHGPERRLYVAGAPLEHAWPLAQIQGNVRFGVTAMSYAGRFGVTVHVDAGALRAEVARQALSDELGTIAGLQ